MAMLVALGRRKPIVRLLRDGGAAIEIEYGLCAAIFLVGAVAVLQLVGVLERL